MFLCCSNQVTSSHLFFPPGPKEGTPILGSISAHALMLGTFPGLRLFLRQTPTIQFIRSPTSKTWGFPLIRLSTCQCIAERLLLIIRRPFREQAKAAFIPLYCAIVRQHLKQLKPTSRTSNSTYSHWNTDVSGLTSFLSKNLSKALAIYELFCIP